LAQALELYDTCRQLIAKVDAKLEALITPLRRQGAQAAQSAAAKSKKRGGKNAPGFDVREALREWAGVDLTLIGGIDVCTALKVLVELGTDLLKFKNAKCFCSWLGLCPGTRISGGKRLSGATKRIPNNRVARALKLAAQGLHHSQCALGAYYRRMAARLGKGKAITATAHKLARLAYAMLTQGGEYVEQSQAQYEEKF
jgi:transposase